MAASGDSAEFKHRVHGMPRRLGRMVEPHLVRLLAGQLIECGHLVHPRAKGRFIPGFARKLAGDAAQRPVDWQSGEVDSSPAAPVYR